MSTTSQKFRDFVTEPMCHKSVLTLPGIGVVLGKRLIDHGYDRAYVVLGQFLVLKKDAERFKAWLKSTTNANSHQAESCYQCLNQWSLSYI